MLSRALLRLAFELCLVAIIATSAIRAYRTGGELSPRPRQAPPALAPELSEDGQVVTVVLLEGIRRAEPDADLSLILVPGGALVDRRGRPMEAGNWGKVQLTSGSPDGVLLIHISVESGGANPISDIRGTVESIKKALPPGQKCLIKFYI